VVEQQVPRPLGQRLLRAGLRAVVPHPAAVQGPGQGRPNPPAAAAERPQGQAAAQRTTPAGARRPATHAALEGCVQPALSPNTNAAAARAGDRLGISVEAGP
jgi:glycolate oxidase iron-sulfur subunit